MRRTAQLSHISELIQKKFQKEPFFLIKSKWDQIVGEIIAKNATPLKITNEILIIKVKNHSWLQELSLSKYKLLNQIKNMKIKLKDIKFTLK